jgi:hypothetical protein
MGEKVKGPHEDLTYRIIGAAMAVHRRIGPGQKEVIYQRALEAELEEAGLSFEAQKNIPVYDGDRLHQKYLGQVITYLNHTGLPVGLLINFGGRSLRWRRVFPSPQATEFRYNYQWMFVPGWLKAQRQEDSSDGAT